MGEPLYALPETPQSQRLKDSLLNIAQLDHGKNSHSLENIIWLGRRLAYLTRYPEAIEVYSDGLSTHPNSPELYRHRGHRYLSMRKIDLAIDDFKRAAALLGNRPVEIEPDGIPNRLNKPLSSLQFNIFYHLGLAHYLKHDWERAVRAYTKCLEYATNDDLLVAVVDWLYMTYRRMGNHQQAEILLDTISDDLVIIENDSYYKRIKFYQGKISEEELMYSEPPNSSLAIATQGYGLGNFHLGNGDIEKAKAIFRKVLDTGYWPAFGHLAAEADLVTLQ